MALNSKELPQRKKLLYPQYSNPFHHGVNSVIFGDINRNVYLK